MFDTAQVLVIQLILETKAETILQLVRGQRGGLHVTFEEGSCAARLHDLLEVHFTRFLVRNSRENTLLKAVNESDRIDFRKLAELFPPNLRRSFFHGDMGLRTMKELAGSYMTIANDLTGVMVRLKAVCGS